MLTQKGEESMKILTGGHRYELENFENKDADGQILQFIHKEKLPEAREYMEIPVLSENEKYDESHLYTVRDGTTNEEILAMMIDRMKFLQAKFPCRENAIVITKLEESLMWLEKRTAERMARGVEGKCEA